MMIKVAVIGAFGRMGSLISKLCREDPEIELVGMIEKEAKGENVYTSIFEMPRKPQVAIDFTSPDVSVKFVEECKNLGIAAVIGTTGFSSTQIERIEEISKDIPILLSPNMSLGVNLLFKITEIATEILKDRGYDIEIFEIHHRFKKDAPSGTAMKLAEIIAEKIGKKLEDVAVYGRQGIIGERKPEEIGVLAARMGDVVGDHTVFFATLGERIELTHRATSRETFARGAVEAAKWIIGKEPGLYNMFDVLGI
jgi:4-hydroxy-tetrahydrodipicolinate reductase